MARCSPSRSRPAPTPERLLSKIDADGNGGVNDTELQGLLDDVAKKSGADAIHPGYGFLSENPEFAEAVAAAGLTLIGPKASSMEAMGTKTRARQVMSRANVPVVPGIERPIADEEII